MEAGGCESSGLNRFVPASPTERGRREILSGWRGCWGPCFACRSCRRTRASSRPACTCIQTAAPTRRAATPRPGRRERKSTNALVMDASTKNASSDPSRGEESVAVPPPARPTEPSAAVKPMAYIYAPSTGYASAPMCTDQPGASKGCQHVEPHLLVQERDEPRLGQEGRPVPVRLLAQHDHPRIPDGGPERLQVAEVAVGHGKGADGVRVGAQPGDLRALLRLRLGPRRRVARGQEKRDDGRGQATGQQGGRHGSRGRGWTVLSAAGWTGTRPRAPRGGGCRG
jgi:hypothetical protein